MENPSFAATEIPPTEPFTTFPVLGGGGGGGGGVVAPSEASTSGGGGREASDPGDGLEASPVAAGGGREVDVLVGEASALPTRSSSSVATFVPVAHAATETTVALSADANTNREKLENGVLTRHQG